MLKLPIVPPKHNKVQKTQKPVIWKKKRHPAQTTLPLLLSTTELLLLLSCCFLAQHSEHWNRLFCTASAIMEGLCSLQTCRQFIAHIPLLDSPSLSFIQKAFAASLLWSCLYKLWPLILSPNSDTSDVLIFVLIWLKKRYPKAAKQQQQQKSPHA